METNFAINSSFNFSFVIPFNQAGLASYASIIIILCVIGIILNGFTIATVLTSSVLKATWYQLITSLAISDLISAIISPFQLYIFTWGFATYTWPNVICIVTWSTDCWTSFITTLHILWFSFLRFFSLQWPHQFKHFVKKHGKTSILLIWIIGFLFGFTFFCLMVGVEDKDRNLPNIASQWPHCGIKPSRVMWFFWYTRIAYPIFYYIPFIMIFCFSAGIVIKIEMMQRKNKANKQECVGREAAIKRRQKEKQIKLQMLLIVGSFLFGYFPTTAFHFFVSEAAFTTDQSYWNLTWSLAISSHVLLRVSECLNPIFYNLSSSFSFALPFNHVGLSSYASTIIILCVIGIILNGLTIATVLTSSVLKATWYQLITSLAVSDLISAIISPSQLFTYTWGFETYDWPELICRITWGTDIWTSYVTTLHILWFSFLRFFSLQWPLQFKIFVGKYGKSSILLIWVVAFLCGLIPFSVIMGTENRDRKRQVITSYWPHCAVAPSRVKWFVWYTRIAYPIFYYIPFGMILCFSVGVVIKVRMAKRRRNTFKRGSGAGSLSRTAEMKRRQKEKQIELQMLLIAGSFLFGYFPTTAFHFFTLGATFTIDQSYWKLTWNFAVSVYVLLRVSECLNPIFYILSSSEMRRETIKKLEAISNQFKCTKQNDVDSSKNSRSTNESTL